MSAQALVVTGVCYDYGKKRALDRVSLHFPGPGILGLLGPNGGGKSTLLQCIATIRKPTAGSVQVFGHDTVAQERAVRSQLGVVFQSRSLDGLLSIEENLRFAGELFGLRGARLRTRIDAVLAQLRLCEHRHERTKTLSGGLARRAELAKALLHEPALLLLDEPSNSLDPEARHDLWAVLAALPQTVVVATHLLEEAERCQMLAFVSGGKRVAYDTPEALRGRAGDDQLVLEPRGAADEFPKGQWRDGKLYVQTKNARADMARLLDALGPKLASLKLQRPTLEDVFLQVTGGDQLSRS